MHIKVEYRCSFTRGQDQEGQIAYQIFELPVEWQTVLNAAAANWHVQSVMEHKKVDVSAADIPESPL